MQRVYESRRNEKLREAVGTHESRSGTGGRDDVSMRRIETLGQEVQGVS